MFHNCNVRFLHIFGKFILTFIHQFGSINEQFILYHCQSEYRKQKTDTTKLDEKFKNKKIKKKFKTNLKLNFANASNSIIRFEFSGFEGRVDAANSELPSSRIFVTSSTGGSEQSKSISTL